MMEISELPGRASTHFFMSPPHEEAHARLEFLVEAGHRCGVLVGLSGTGKTALLRQFAKELRSNTITPVLVDVAELSSAEALQRVLTALGVTSHAGCQISELWIEVDDTLAGQRQRERKLCLIFDHVDRSSADCQQMLRRLLTQNNTQPGLVFILAFSGRISPQLTRDWRNSADMRIELVPLSLNDTVLFTQSWLSALDLSRELFDRAAMESLHRVSRGIPRDVIRLCEMAVLSAIHDEHSRVSEDVVEAARRELSMLRYSA